MKKRHSFRRRLFAGFLLASLLPLLLCSAMLLQIFRLRLDSQLEEESREQLDHVISSLDGLYRKNFCLEHDGASTARLPGWRKICGVSL